MVAHSPAAAAREVFPVLRLIGALIVILLIIGPLLMQAGLLDNAGLLHDFVALEIRAFTDLVDWIRAIFHQ